MRWGIFLLAGLSIVFASGCATIKNDRVAKPAGELKVCFAYGCKKSTLVTLNKEQWLVINGLFLPKATSAEKERAQIALAIGQMEQFVGDKTLTKNDLPGTFEALFTNLDDQMDCVDEATNTTLYLQQFRQRGLMTFHLEKPRINRGFFFNGWPHTAAMIIDTKTKKKFAVDSWFHKNGVPAEIMPTNIWYSGWWPAPEDIKR